MALTITPNVSSIDSKTGTLTATNILDTIKTVDGATSGLDADFLDGNDSSYFQQALVSGTNIKTINGNTILGSGNLTVAGVQRTYTEYVATSGQTVFSAVYNTADLDLFLNGVLLNTADYTAINGTSITLTTGATAGDVLAVKTYISIMNTTSRDIINIISANTTALAFNNYTITTSLTLTLPAAPTAGDWVRILNVSGNTTACIIGRNGSNIMKTAENMTIDILHTGITLTYVNATYGWMLF